MADTITRRGVVGMPKMGLAPRIPPQDLAAEQAVLGSVLIKPAALFDIDDILKADDFYLEKHRIIFRLMAELSGRNEPIDFVSLNSLLTKQKLLEKIGGSGYLVELSNFVPSASSIKHYAGIVRQKSTLRRLIESADRILQLGFSENETLENILEQAEKAILGLGDFTKRAYTHIKDALPEAWERLDRLHHAGDGLRGVSTGFKDLDNKLSGFQKSDLIILASRPSVGKTSLALDFARHAACKQNVPTLIFSLEMSHQQLTDRLLSAESYVDAWKIRNGKGLVDEEFTRIQDALGILAAAPIFIDDQAANTITNMRSLARRIKAEHKLGLIIVDYLQLMIPKKDSDSLVQQVTEISRSLKQLARELDVPVVALSQLNRSVEQRGGKPRLSDLRDSGSIEQDADVVMFIHREKPEGEDSTSKQALAEIIIAKHRNGPTGEVQLYFDDKRTSFTTIEKNDFGSF